MILVIGASGKVGGAAVRQLSERGIPVRAFVRDPARTRFPVGVEVVRGNLDDPESLRKALRGVDDVFLVWAALELDPTPVLDLLTSHARRVIHLSSDGVNDEVEEQADPINGMHARIERQLRASGIRRTTIRGGGFASNDLEWAKGIRANGVVRDPFPKARRSMVHEADLAEVGVVALTENGHDGATYTVTGPEMLSTEDRVAMIGEAVGRPLRLEEQPLEEARMELSASGLPDDFIDAILEAHELFSRPDYEEQLNPSSAVTGRPARTYRQWAQDHAADFR
ncbi:NAD(P)H-binding protein [Spiractinospora alimapuensis]|uniref:NmrA family NAD(P)-binding protein n=1 Tax=Spiractinospora alimapuensis TaxID=2820884 RepID=UPI001F389FBD|nr:NAD(P)H-binding protein [Spiractinospora alimapuensis]QVQ51689.1 NAD(P)H-binding protein [Spiractinospora alimapuensis]